MADGLLFAQDVVIQSCKIVGVSGQPIDIKNAVVELNIFEDIFSNFTSGSLIISDSMGYVQMFQFQGQEKIILVIDKPGLNDPYSVVGNVYKISGRTQTKTSHENYILHFCSEEVSINEQYKVSKSYNNAKIIDIVKDITHNILEIDAKKFGDYDNTTGMRDIVVPNLKPFQTINWLCTFARSDDAKSPGSFFLFYENRNGFHFKSILTLYKQPVYRKYEYEEKNFKYSKNDTVPDLNKDFVNVIAFEHMNSFDSLNAIKSGALANKTITVDPLRLKFGESNFNYGTYSKDAQQLDQGSIPNSAKNRKGDLMSDTTGAIKFCVSTTGQSQNQYIKNKEVMVNEHNPEQTSSVRTAQLALLFSTRYKLMIPGDVQMTIGKIIEFNKPEISYNNSNKEKKSDPFYSGKYLVTAVRHIINQEGKFQTIIEICKDSFPTNFNTFDNSNPAWKGVR
jgi:hypothetical protein